jgi:hypothetical protein
MKPHRWHRLCFALLSAMVFATYSAAEFLPQAPPNTGTASARAASPSAAEGLRKAISALSRAQEALGGLHRLQAIRDITRVVEMEHHQSGSKAQETVQIIFPTTIRLTTESDLGEITAFFDGTTGWCQTQWGIDDPLPQWQTRAAQQDLFRQLESLLQSNHDPERTVEFVERGEVDAKPADVLQVSSQQGGAIRLWIDVASGDVLKLEYPRLVPRGKGPVASDFFSDYRWVGQVVRVPFKIRSLADGEPYMDTIVTRIEYNKGIRPEDLARKDSVKAP